MENYNIGDRVRFIYWNLFKVIKTGHITKTKDSFWGKKYMVISETSKDGESFDWVRGNKIISKIDEKPEWQGTSSLNRYNLK